MVVVVVVVVLEVVVVLVVGVTTPIVPVFNCLFQMFLCYFLNKFSVIHGETPPNSEACYEPRKQVTPATFPGRQPLLGLHRKVSFVTSLVDKRKHILLI